MSVEAIQGFNLSGTAGDVNQSQSQSLISNNLTGTAINITGLAQDIVQHAMQMPDQANQIIKDVLKHLPTGDQRALMQQLERLVLGPNAHEAKPVQESVSSGVHSSLGELATASLILSRASVATSVEAHMSFLSSESLKQHAAEKLKKELAKKAKDKKAFHKDMKAIFGDSYDENIAEGLRQRVLDGDFGWLNKDN